MFRLSNSFPKYNSPNSFKIRLKLITSATNKSKSKKILFLFCDRFASFNPATSPISTLSFLCDKFSRILSSLILVSSSSKLDKSKTSISSLKGLSNISCFPSSMNLALSIGCLY